MQHLPDTSIATLLVGLAMLVILLGLEKFVPRAPAPLIAVAVGISAMAFLDLQSQGVATVGQIPEGLPSITLPDMALVAELWPSALGIALMSFTESTAAARAFAVRGEPRPDANQELLATGLSNIGGGLLGLEGTGGDWKTFLMRVVVVGLCPCGYKGDADAALVVRAFLSAQRRGARDRVLMPERGVGTVVTEEENECVLGNTEGV